MVAYVFEGYTANFAFQLFITLKLDFHEICFSSKK